MAILIDESTAFINLTPLVLSMSKDAREEVNLTRAKQSVRAELVEARLEDHPFAPSSFLLPSSS